MTTTRGEIVKEYLRKFPSVSSKKLSETIAKEVPELELTPEAARKIIRYYRGADGEHSRRNIKAENYMPKIDVPPGEPENYEPYILPADSYPIIVGADAHVPYHDKRAVDTFIERARAIKAKTIVLLGDWLDFYTLSVFLKDPRMRDVAGEIETFKTILGIMREACPEARIIYKLGNHDERWNDYIMRNAPMLYHMAEVHLENVLGLDDLKIEIVQNKRVLKADHLHLIHGHEYRFAISNPVNPARGLYLRAKKSALCGHFHQPSDHTESAINGDIVTCWSVGCLCGLHPQYMPLNKWAHGFAEIEGGGGFFDVRNRRIIGGKLL